MPQWRNPPPTSRDTRRPTEDIRISSGEPNNKKVRGKTSSANGAKEDHGIQISRTGTADFIPTCHKTSPTTETEGGERESQLCQVTGILDLPVSSQDWNHTDVFSVSVNLSPIHCPNGWSEMIGGWSDERTGQHSRPMESRERTVCLHVLIHGTEDRCRLD